MLHFSLEESAELVICVDPVERDEDGDEGGENGTDIKMCKAGDKVTNEESPDDVTIKRWQDSHGGKNDCDKSRGDREDSWLRRVFSEAEVRGWEW